jgi:hypothetical protein
LFDTWSSLRLGTNVRLPEHHRRPPPRESEPTTFTAHPAQRTRGQGVTAHLSASSRPRWHATSEWLRVLGAVTNGAKERAG